MKILIVDDHSAIRNLLKNMLEEMGIDTLEVCNGKDAITKLESNKDINLVILDWNIPEMNGTELLDWLRTQDKLSYSPKIMMVTTENGVKKIELAIEKGADEYIMMPFTKEILEGKLSILGIEKESHV